jgi:hypothetical protein
MVLRRLLHLLALASWDPGARAAEAPIQDNSFLVEEAYNQEPGVVQHITVFNHSLVNGSWAIGFTQEWPVVSQRHQLSYTLAYLDPEDRGAGWGDVLVNYRYQALGLDGGNVAFAPRISFSTGSGGNGSGASGLQANLPLSVTVGDRIALHSNLGGTWLPDARNDAGQTADLTAWSAAQSVVWLARPRFNVLAEFLFISGHEIVGPNRTTHRQEFFASPGSLRPRLPERAPDRPGIAFPHRHRRAGVAAFFSI